MHTHTQTDILSVYLLRAITSGQTPLIGLKKLLGYKREFNLVSTHDLTENGDV